MRRPKIAVTGSYDRSNDQYYLNRSYMDSIRKAGGTPIVVNPPIEPPAAWTGELKDLYAAAAPEEGLLDGIDGLLLTGGGDVSPRFYNSLTQVCCGEGTPMRDAFEVQLAQWAVAQNIPCLGICRGIQVMAVSLGVPLFQDINGQANNTAHQQPAATWYPTHEVEVRQDGHLKACLGEKAWVNSHHHQAIMTGLESYPFDITAVSPDGYIEGIEKPELKFFVGVQWHPERMVTSTDMQALFKRFVQASAGALN